MERRIREEQEESQGLREENGELEQKRQTMLREY
jgi:hypothetical protein